MDTTNDPMAVAAAVARVTRLQRNDRLRELRESRGLTQVDVARCLQISQSNISRWERGGRMRAEHAVALLALFDAVDDERRIA